jgi:hypothetical protein
LIEELEDQIVLTDTRCAASLTVILFRDGAAAATSIGIAHIVGCQRPRRGGGMRWPIRKSTYRVSQCIEHDLPLPKGASKNVVDLVRYEDMDTHGTHDAGRYLFKVDNGGPRIP